MRAGPMLRRALLAGLLATAAGCTHRETPPAVTPLSDAGARAPDAPGDVVRATAEPAPPWRLRLTRL